MPFGIYQLIEAGLMRGHWSPSLSVTSASNNHEHLPNSRRTAELISRFGPTVLIGGPRTVDINDENAFTDAVPRKKKPPRSRVVQLTPAEGGGWTYEIEWRGETLTFGRFTSRAAASAERAKTLPTLGSPYKIPYSIFSDIPATYWEEETQGDEQVGGVQATNGVHRVRARVRMSSDGKVYLDRLYVESGGEITASVLREIPTTRMLGQAVASVNALKHERVATWNETRRFRENAPVPSWALESGEVSRPSVGRPALSQDSLREIAEACVNEYDGGRRGLDQRVAQRLGLPITTVRDRKVRARKAGWLAEARPGVRSADAGPRLQHAWHEERGTS